MIVEVIITIVVLAAVLGLIVIEYDEWKWKRWKRLHC